MQPRGAGSGVIVDQRLGYIITNFHVVDGGEKVFVTYEGSEPYEVKVIGVDPGTDLALLQFLNVPKGLTQVDFGDSSYLEVGQRILAIGNPFGLQRTLTTGIISSLG